MSATGADQPDREATREIFVCCGVGGTGKTTTSAALGVGHALAGRRVVVLTIDPARRLADALGLESLGNTAREIEVPGATGSLHALMLDRKGTWDQVIRRFSPTPETAEKLLSNRYYRAISTRLTGSHEYMAIEKLHELVESDRWDLVVVDTPPTQHVLDFLHAPDRVRRIFDSSVLRGLVDPGRGLVGAATRRALTLLERLAGARVMEDIAEFFSLIGELSGGFRARSKAVSELLASHRTRYWLVADANAPERNDLLGFLAALRERRMRFAGFLVNRVARAPDLAGGRALPEAVDGLDEATWAEWRAALERLASRADEDARRHRDAAAALSSAADGAPVWLIPEIPEGVRNIEGLGALSVYLPPHPRAL